MPSMKNRLLFCLFILIVLPSLLRAEGLAAGADPFFFGVALDGYPITAERLQQVKEEIGGSPRIVLFFVQWPSSADQGSARFPGESLDAIWSEGAIPCLTWEPMEYSRGREAMVPYEAVLDGTYDPYLVRFAEQSRAWSKPFLIRFAHEMNISRYHWGTEAIEYGPESPRIYRRMFRYVVAIFQKARVRNVAWVFCPNSESVPNVSYDAAASWNRMDDYYPGDALVDVLGMDGYNWGTTRKKSVHGWESRWRDFASIFGPARETLRRLAPHKPLFVFETASVDQGGDKNLWIRNAFKTAGAWNLNGLVWFQVNKEYDWRMGVPCPCPPEAMGLSPHQWMKGLLNDRR